ncbi:zinc ribbon domain-containing protein, partial [Haloactinopolyspora sp.]|uniref:zinc ribbon domain-containing protein n=1 Tax=Haloactinopolyspora sp. TaxID=1966353 RepID=UPI0026165CEB
MSERGTLMYCVRCGAHLEDRARFCSACGAPVADRDSADKPGRRRRRGTIAMAIVAGVTTAGAS